MQNICNTAANVSSLNSTVIWTEPNTEQGRYTPGRGKIVPRNLNN